MTRLLQKKNLMNLAFLAAALHAMLGTLMTIVSLPALWVVDKALLGLLAAALVVAAALRPEPLRVDAAQTLLILSIVWYLFSCLSMSIKYNNDWVSYNAEPLLNTAVSLLVIFPLGCAVSRYGWTKFGKILLQAILLLWSAFILFALIRVFQGEGILLSNGGAVYMYYDSLWLNCNRNTTGAIELVFFMACCCWACRSKSVVGKVLFGVTIPIHYAALILSNSRTAIYSALFVWAATAGIMTYLMLKNKKSTLRLAIALSVSVAAAAVYYLLRDQVFALYNACSQAVSTSSAAPTQVSDQTAAAIADQTRDLLVNGSLKMDSRLALWRATLEGIVTSFRTFIFGVTPPSVPSLIDQIRGTNLNWYTHNQFLEIAASTGVPGLCIFLAWLILMVRDMYRLVFKRKDLTALWLVPVMILALLIANMTEATLLYYVFLEGYCFFFLCGIIHGAVNDAPAGKKLSRQAQRNKDRKKKARK